MSLDADTIVDRRRMRRKLTFWRVFAVFIAIASPYNVQPGSKGPEIVHSNRNCNHST